MKFGQTFLISLIGFTLLLFFFATDLNVLRVRIRQLPYKFARRLSLGDVEETEEEMFCRAPHQLPTSKDPIPHVAHFILVSKPGQLPKINYATFLAFKATIVRMRPDKIKLHTFEFNEDDQYWKELAPFVELVKHHREEFPAPRNLKLEELKLAHQADIIRLAILYKEGGIYLDTDVYPLKSFRDLLNNPRPLRIKTLKRLNRDKDEENITYGAH